VKERGRERKREYKRRRAIERKKENEGVIE
jgi:hypothetical protein